MVLKAFIQTSLKVFFSLIGSWNNSICAYSIEYGRTYQYNGAHRDAISCMDWNKGI